MTRKVMTLFVMKWMNIEMKSDDNYESVETIHVNIVDSELESDNDKIDEKEVEIYFTDDFDGNEMENEKGNEAIIIEPGNNETEIDNEKLMREAVDVTE